MLGWGGTPELTPICILPHKGEKMGKEHPICPLILILAPMPIKGKDIPQPEFGRNADMSYTMRAKFGLSLSNRAVLFGWATLNDLLDAAQMAEQSGYFHGVWVGDNLLSKPRAEAIVTLSAIAARTQEVKLGTICLASFPLRDPILLAIQWASLDLLSQGRTILGVCNGGSALDGPPFGHELEVMEVKSHERVGRVLEGIAILRRLWSEARVTHAG
jgi:alkanesulfonate monooxygenase SsuD/methylene tetrahydromethanopterin reductase-like flavin-dependent oxidoreductase (luciferase family)